MTDRIVDGPATDGAGDGARAPALLEASALACERGNRLLFRDLGLRAGPGEALQVLGPNGSGKTSLLRILCGLSEPAFGEVRWRGRPVRPGDPEHLGELAYLAHADGLKRELTAVENLRAAVSLHAAGPLDARAALERLGVAPHADEPVRSLSAGQRRRVALARLLMRRATAWVLDEPLNALDRAGIEQVNALIDAHLSAGGLAVLTSHLPLEVAGGRLAAVDLG